MRIRRVARATLLWLLSCASAGAQIVPSIAPFYSGTYSLASLGTVAGLPPSAGGLTFKAGDPSTLFIGGNDSSRRFYEVPVIRGAGNHIVSFGTPVARGFGASNDGGIAYGPGGVLFYSQYPANRVAQVKPGSNTDDKVIALAPLGIAESTGGLNFVPAGYNGAGQLKVSSWPHGEFYTVGLAADGSGTYDLIGATLEVILGGGPEGFAYVPLGSPLFDSQSMLVAEYSAGNVAAYTIDANGNPVPESRRTFVTGLLGAEGAAVDPLTGDFLFSTYDDGENDTYAGIPNQVIAVRGFTLPAPVPAVDLNQRGLTGSWHSPAVGGQGIELEVYPDAIAPGIGYLFGGWATFIEYLQPPWDYDSGPRWYTFGGEVVAGQASATLTLYENVGGIFNAPPAISSVPVGTVVLRAGDCATLALEYSSSHTGALESMPLVRLLPNVTCSTIATNGASADYGLSGNWFDPATSGQGFAFELNPIAGVVFFVWYTYGANGQTHWYTGEGTYVPGSRTLPVTLFETNLVWPPGLLYSRPFTARSVAVGTATATFFDCHTAQLTFEFTEGSNAEASGTIDLVRVGPSPAECAP